MVGVNTVGNAGFPGKPGIYANATNRTLLLTPTPTAQIARDYALCLYALAFLTNRTAFQILRYRNLFSTANVNRTPTRKQGGLVDVGSFGSQKPTLIQYFTLSVYRREDDIDAEMRSVVT